MRDIQTIFQEREILRQYMDVNDHGRILRIPLGGYDRGLQCTVVLFNVNEMTKEDLGVFIKNGWEKLPEEDGYCRGLYIQYEWKEEE